MHTQVHGDAIQTSRSNALLDSAPGSQRQRPRWRHVYKLAASAFAISAAFGWSGNADAANECGLASPGDTVHCNNTFYNFPGIDYSVDDLTIAIGESGVPVAIPQNVYNYAFVALEGYGTETVTAGTGVVIHAGYSDAIEVISHGDEYTLSAQSFINSSADITSFEEGIEGEAHANYSGYGGNLSWSNASKSYTDILNQGHIHVIAEGSQEERESGIRGASYTDITLLTGNVTHTAYGSAITRIINTGEVINDIDHTGASYAYSGIYGYAETTVHAGIGSAGTSAHQIYTELLIYNEPVGLLPVSVGNASTATILTTAPHTPGITGLAYADVHGDTGAYSHMFLDIYNEQGGNITTLGAHSDGVDFTGHNYAYMDGTQGQAVATTDSNILNRGLISTQDGNGIRGEISTTATNNGNASNSDALATSNLWVYNGGNITAGGNNYDGIYVTDYSVARALTGNATATSTLTVINSTGGIIDGAEGVYAHSDGRAYANASYSAAGATANVNVSNRGSITATGVDGVHAESYAYGQAATGYGTASANTTISNESTGTITGSYNGIYGSAYAEVNRGQYDATATARLKIYNSGSVTGESDAIRGYSDAHAYGNHSVIARAYTTFDNVSGGEGGPQLGGSLTSTDGDGLRLESNSYARMYGCVSSGFASSSAFTLVTNDDTILAAGDGIYAASDARARGGSGGNYAHAEATLDLSNSGTITVGNGSAGIAAFTYSRAFDTPSATGYSRVLLSNSGNITAGASGGYSKTFGIDAYSHTEANGENSGSAKARTSVTNHGVIKVFGEGGAGIYAGAYATADAFVANAGYETVPGNHSGSRVSVFNYNAVSTYGNFTPGIAAVSQAKTYGFDSSNANAYSFVYNHGAVSTTGHDSPGVSSVALSTAEGVAFLNLHSESNAQLSNYSAVTTLGYTSPGLIVASAALSGSDGGEGSVAAAYATLRNDGNVTTGSGNGTSGYSFSPAIISVSLAAANIAGESSLGCISSYFGGFTGTLGGNFSLSDISGTYSDKATATSTTIVVNNGNLSTHDTISPGIFSLSVAYAYGNGNATFVSQVTLAPNVGAYAGTGTIATSSIAVTNHGSITTLGNLSFGIGAISIAAVNGTYNYGLGGNATSSILVSNTGTITTHGDGAHGILALSYATSYDGSGNLTSTIGITNSGNISATGVGADGILAFALGTGNISVTNSGNVTGGTFGNVSLGGFFPTPNSAGVQPNASNASDLLFYGGVGVGAYGDKAVVVNNSGTIGALSDQALALFADTESGNITVINNVQGTLIGLVYASAHQSELDNSGTWVVRGGTSHLQTATTTNYSTTYGNSLIGGSGSGHGLVVNDVGGKILVVGNQQIDLSTFTNKGLVSLAERDTGSFETGHTGAGQFEKLVIGGDYVSDGGSLALDVNLQTGEHDLLHVTGGVTGGTTVEVLPSGTPAPTTGDGIKLIQVDGTITGGAPDFQLQGANHRLVAGLYEYDLNLLPGNVTGGGWYLQTHIPESTFDLANVNAGALVAFGMSNISFGDLMSNLPASSIQGASLDEYPKLASADDGFIPGKPSEVGKVGVWGRFMGDSLAISPKGSPAPFNVQAQFAQVGVDYTMATDNGGTLLVGGFAGYANSDLNFKASTASAKMQGGIYGGYGLFVTGKWEFGLLGSIGDGSLRYRNPTTGTHFNVSPGMWGMSAMIAEKEELDDGVFVQPRVEFTYARIGDFHFTDSSSTLVHVSPTENATGILGMKIGKRFMGMDGMLWTPYIDLALNDEFAGKTKVTATGASLSTELSGLTGKGGVGLNVSFSNQMSLYGRVDYVTGRTEKGVKGFVGFRFLPQ